MVRRHSRVGEETLSTTGRSVTLASIWTSRWTVPADRWLLAHSSRCVHTESTTNVARCVDAEPWLRSRRSTPN